MSRRNLLYVLRNLRLACVRLYWARYWPTWTSPQYFYKDNKFSFRCVFSPWNTVENVLLVTCNTMYLMYCSLVSRLDTTGHYIFNEVVELVRQQVNESEGIEQGNSVSRLQPHTGHWRCKGRRLVQWIVLSRNYYCKPATQDNHSCISVICNERSYYCYSFKTFKT